jgi:hypothetical protein
LQRIPAWLVFAQSKLIFAVFMLISRAHVTEARNSLLPPVAAAARKFSPFACVRNTRCYFPEILDCFDRLLFHSIRAVVQGIAAMSFESLNRRNLFQLSLGGAAALSLPRLARAQEAPALKEFRIGYQKNGILVIARQQSAFESSLGKQVNGFKMVEFS